MGIDEVTTDINTHGGDRTVPNKLGELCTVSATEIEYGSSTDIT